MKNVLVQYQGGGYEGCFWEWNFFWLDKDGVFYDVFSSGRDGITTDEQAKELLGSGNTHYVYDLTDNKVIDELSKECNVVNLTDLLRWFENNPQDGIKFYLQCSVCHEKIEDLSECSLENWHGCGGIMSTADLLLCSDCLSLGTCDCCNEYIGETDLLVLYHVESDSELVKDNKYLYPAVRAMIDEHFNDVCQYCLDYKAEQLKEMDKKDLLFRSLTTGKPDLFSNDMRWLHRMD